MLSKQLNDARQLAENVEQAREVVLVSAQKPGSLADEIGDFGENQSAARTLEGIDSDRI